MTVSTPIESLFLQEQFRMCRLQVFNWGTFSGLHNVPISPRGFLFVGRSGAGKSTLLDAFSALLVPPRWVDFNAAAREAERSGRDRNLVSYIRGAWAEQKDGDSGEIVTRYLRAGTTWSALALTYRNELGHIVVLVRLFWIRGNASGNSDVKPHFLIFERDFDLSELESFGQSNFDIRKLKQSFPEAFSKDEFRPYCERFCRLLGIESEMALRLLHKTQSAKNLGDLNTFLREFMLDKPETFTAADRLVSEFVELNAAHQAVVTAREQVQALIPARDKHQQLDALNTQKKVLVALQNHVPDYCEIRRYTLLKESIHSLTIDIEGLTGEMASEQERRDNQKSELYSLERQHRETGGEQIESWENEKRILVGQREERIRRRQQATEACQKLGWTLLDTPKDFAKLTGEARSEIERQEDGNSALQEEFVMLASRKKEAETTFSSVSKEIRALQQQPSNIPAAMLELRQQIASAINVAETSLPFVGELIEVKAEEASWQGAIERVLRGFALSLLVDERHYTSLANYINNTQLGQRLVYYRTGHVETRPGGMLHPGSLFLKLNIKDVSYAGWLKAELRQRFDYLCVESVQAFRHAERALTHEGQIKHGKARHEKDDRWRLNDRKNWVLGFNNREKLALFQQQAQEIATTISGFDSQIATLTHRSRERDLRARQCQTLVNLQWQDIDVVTLLQQIEAIDTRLRDKREDNAILKTLAERIVIQKSLVEQSDGDLRDLMVKCQEKKNQIEQSKTSLNAIAYSDITPLSEEIKLELDERYAKSKLSMRLDTLDRITTEIIQSLNKEVEGLNQHIGNYEKQIENIFSSFKRTWPMDASDLDDSLSSAPDFFAKLARLETDGLPAHEERFFELLQNQSHQNLAALSSYLNDARKAILERMDLVNKSLSQVPFNQSSDQCTYLHIDASDRQLPEVREFRQDIQQSLSFAWSETREFAEARFLTLRRLVERLSSQDPEQKRWRESVLDVRLHVEFIGREIDEEGVEVETYRSGAGKSGGQRQKLATTCLAAALRYQLGGSDLGVPIYAPVVLDEAFDKADNEFTALVMNIFKNFGFQMIVATPLKAVMTLEPFIGGACFVDISDRRVSGVLLIEYDDKQQRLDLPKHAREEAENETT